MADMRNLSADPTRANMRLTTVFEASCGAVHMTTSPLCGLLRNRYEILSVMTRSPTRLNAGSIEGPTHCTPFARRLQQLQV